MPVTVVLKHLTRYVYEPSASLSPQTIRLRPAPHCRTPILSYGLKITPAEHFINWMQDPQGNYLARVAFPERVSEFAVEVSVVAEMIAINPFDFFLEDYAENFPFAYETHLQDELEPYLDSPVDTGAKWQAFFDRIDRSPKHIVQYLVDLNQSIREVVDYTIRLEPGIQTPEETLEKGSGSCRDSAWLLINMLRGLGLAARFASGYLVQLTADQKAIDGPTGPETDFTDLHAWAEVYLPGAGWVGLDPTSGLLAGEGHIPLACSPNPLSAAPITGSTDAPASDFSFDMSVERLKDPPRASRPYEDSTWQDISDTGFLVDERLEQLDIRLTMGGEPTFVSCDNPDAPEWNGEAVGEEKQRLSETLLRKLYARFAPGGLLHYGQGKWYPGESLPRWAYTCYWREDGEPLWNEPDLLASPVESGEQTIEDVGRFSASLSKRLGVESEYLISTYEDVGYYLWKERKLPTNVDAIDNRLKDPEERARLARTFERGLDQPKGWTLPIKYQSQQGKWISSKWPLRNGSLFLLPGDSPIGLRLPLESLPYAPPGSVEPTYQEDPMGFEPDRPLPSPGRQQAASETTDDDESSEDNQRQKQVLDRSAAAAKDIARTALCFELRDGHIMIFMPPLPKFTAYQELIEAIEATASELKLPVIIEGERPPFDPRIKQLSVTPDPGVIEANIQPASNWGELQTIIEGLYEDATQSRLKADKLQHDGRQTGSGGGCHIVVGGSIPSQSPFLRNPKLLGSMIAYWQRHPSLSFLFSGMFVGPTSQSPRIDEARHDSLYEMEIALKEMNKLEKTPPWMVDRLFRHLLTDLTGNTHRAEFCIDKLYNPDRSSGRLGLLELRAFEMPPHPQMCLALQLLVRALIAHLAKNPFQPRRLVRWGAELHDRFMLPHYNWEDFLDVLTDLRNDGLPIKESWFEPHFAFRFPLNGKFGYKEIEVELRQAIEPWITLGEESSSSGTARYVDSSLERLQIKTRNYSDERYELRCNDIPIPVANTGRHGEYVGGLRYRAWQPPSCMHPTIPVDTPLRIDLVDTGSGIAVAGCRYYVGHPGGRNYDDSPINSLEADGRWRAKFDPHGQTPGVAPAPRVAPSPYEYPMTLDMRRLR